MRAARALLKCGSLDGEEHKTHNYMPKGESLATLCNANIEMGGAG